MADLQQSILRDELGELHAYAREFFRIQILWIIFVGTVNVVALSVFFSESLNFEVTAKPPLCIAFAILNLATAAQCFIRRFDYQLLANQIDETYRALTGDGASQRGAFIFPLEWSVRTSSLYTLATALLAATWGICCLHVWRHEQLPYWVYFICIAVFLIVMTALGVILGRQVTDRRRQLAA
jgi:hypothetical protein